MAIFRNLRDPSLKILCLESFKMYYYVVTYFNAAGFLDSVNILFIILNLPNMGHVISLIKEIIGQPRT